jgi:small subunit ribosomal protein S5
MSFRSQAASKLRRLIFAKHQFTPLHQQYHSVSSTAAARRSHLSNIHRYRVGLCFNRSIFTEEDYKKGRYYEPGNDSVEQKRRKEKIKAGLDTADDAEEDEDEDYFGIQHLIDQIDKEEENQNIDRSERRQKRPPNLNRFEELTDSDTDSDDERFSEGAQEKQDEEKEMKLKKRYELFENFNKSENIDDAFKWMEKINKFEEKFLDIRPEYRVIGELMNRLKETTDLKEKFLLQHKLNRGLRLVEFREKFNPKDPANYGLINAEQAAEHATAKDGDKKNRFQQKREEEQFEKEDDKEVKDEKDDEEDDDELEFDAEKEKDDILLENLAKLDKKLEEKIAALDHTFGKKGKLLEAEIRDLAEERNAITEKRRRPQYRIGFDVYPIYLNRTCKVTKGGRVKSYTAIVACGNYNGVVGFAKAKGPGGQIAYQKAYEKCFQNLHTIERHEEHTIAHAVQAEYEKTKVYLWPARTQTGMKAGKTVQAILNLAGFKNIKSKVVGSRNPHNIIKALFKALNAIETPKDVQEKYGRTVVESYLL